MAYAEPHSRSSCLERDRLSKKNVPDGSGISQNETLAKTVTNSNPLETERNRDRVMKELGSSSTVFIGPASRPSKAVKLKSASKPTKAIREKPNMEDTLSDFYKELDKIDSADSPDGSVMVSDRLDVNQRRTSNGPDCTFRPHWIDNEPYKLRRQRPSFDQNSDGKFHPYPQNYWQPPPPFKSPPHFRFHRPPSPSPPPSFTGAWGFPNRTPPISSDWPYPGDKNLYVQVPSMHKFAPDEYRSQDFYDHPPFHFNSGGRGYNYEDCTPDYVNENQTHFEEEQNSEWQQNLTLEHEHHRHGNQPPHGTHNYHPTLVLILMRGAPGSGKSTLARELLSTGPNGLIFSTDDYFSQEQGYCYDRSNLGEAHEWNQKQAKEAMWKGCTPVIIDNTNMQAWEMKPYVKMALERGYSIFFHEPDTSWKWNPIELAKRNKHGVSHEKIAQMLDRFSFPISVAIVMNSKEPTLRNVLKQHEISVGPT